MTSIFDDEDYKNAYMYADVIAKKYYSEEAEYIDNIQKKIHLICSNEQPYDVFICYKESDENGNRTKDSVLAQELYYGLKKENLKAFFAPITLEGKLGTEYEPYIYSALVSAPVMVVISTKPEYVDAVWVKNEWKRYIDMINHGQDKVLIPAYRDMDPYDLPAEFAHLQAQDMSKLGFMQDLIRGIKKILHVEDADNNSSVPYSGVSATESSYLERAYIFLEDNDWDKASEYLEKVLDINPKNANAYVGKLMVEFHLSKIDELGNENNLFEDNLNYQKAMRYADESLKLQLISYIDNIKERLNERQKAESYNKVVSAFDSLIEESGIASICKKCKNITYYSAECNEDYNDLLFESPYMITCENCNQKTDFAVFLFTEAELKDYIRNACDLYKQFCEFSEYKQAEKYAKECLKFIETGIQCTPNNELKETVEFFNSLIAILEDEIPDEIDNISCIENYKEMFYQAADSRLKNSDELYYAESIFGMLKNYKDSADKAVICKEKIVDEKNQCAYIEARNDLENAKTYDEIIAARNKFKNIHTYKDADEFIKKCNLKIYELACNDFESLEDAALDKNVKDTISKINKIIVSLKLISDSDKEINVLINKCNAKAENLSLANKLHQELINKCNELTESCNTVEEMLALPDKWRNLGATNQDDLDFLYMNAVEKIKGLDEFKGYAWGSDDDYKDHFKDIGTGVIVMIILIVLLAIMESSQSILVSILRVICGITFLLSGLLLIDMVVESIYEYVKSRHKFIKRALIRKLIKRGFPINK